MLVYVAVRYACKLRKVLVIGISWDGGPGRGSKLCFTEDKATGGEVTGTRAELDGLKIVPLSQKPR